MSETPSTDWSASPTSTRRPQVGWRHGIAPFESWSQLASRRCGDLGVVLRKYDRDRDALDDSLCLWRYMSFDRFVHLLATETLWLAPLSSMEDKREGKWIDVQASKFQDRVQQGYDHAAAQTVVSSWIAADEELLPMWNSYAPADTGIAISTDVYSLLRTLAEASLKDDLFYLMRVEYCDQPRTIPVAIPGGYDPVLCAKYKSSDFQYENEVRVVYGRSVLSTPVTVGVPIPAAPGKGTHVLIKKVSESAETWLMRAVEPGAGTHTRIPMPLPDGVEGVLPYDLVPPISGTYIKIKSIHALAKNGVFVSPRANPWMVETVKSVMRNYGHNPALVRPSALTPNFATPSSPPFRHNITY